MRHIKKYVRLVLGIILLALGIGFMVIPFIPIGYIFIFVALFFLATYIPPLSRFLDYLKEKDKSGRLDEVEHKLEDFEERLGADEEEDDSSSKHPSNKANTNPKDKPSHLGVKKVKGDEDHSKKAD